MDHGQNWKHLGAHITQGRLARVPRWLQKDLAEATGLTTRTIGNYERGNPPKSAPRIPDGYYAVASALGWSAGSIEDLLKGGKPTPKEESSAEAAASINVIAELTASGSVSVGIDPSALYPGVVGFGRLCVQRGGDPRLRDLMEEAAERLLASVPSDAPSKSDLALAAYRPQGWAEGDPAVPPDDAERIRRALEDHDRNR